jgi:putative endonuclease
MFTVYILYSDNLDQFYVGHTGNLDDRIKRHNQGRSKSTKTGVPWKLMYSEKFDSKSEAYQREMYIKRMKSRTFIEKLITG